MSMDWVADVKAFHEKFGVLVGDEPQIADERTMRLRRALMSEEHGELCDAMLNRMCLSSIADALIDSAYVEIGTLVSCGLWRSGIPAYGHNECSPRIIEGWQVHTCLSQLCKSHHEVMCWTYGRSDEAWRLNAAIRNSLDAKYVTARWYGIDLGPLWDEVHRTNMAKVGGKTRADGKILKPDGWQPPRIQELLDVQVQSAGAAEC